MPASGVRAASTMALVYTRPRSRRPRAGAAQAEVDQLEHGIAPSVASNAEAAVTPGRPGRLEEERDLDLDAGPTKRATGPRPLPKTPERAGSQHRLGHPCRSGARRS